MENTRILDPKKIKKEAIHQTLKNVAESLSARGYNVSSQISGYLISNDPAYITSYNDARKNIQQFDRYEIIEELIDSFLNIE